MCYSMPICGPMPLHTQFLAIASGTRSGRERERALPTDYFRSAPLNCEVPSPSLPPDQSANLCVRVLLQSLFYRSIVGHCSVQYTVVRSHTSAKHGCVVYCSRPSLGEMKRAGRVGEASRGVAVCTYVQYVLVLQYVRQYCSRVFSSGKVGERGVARLLSTVLLFALPRETPYYCFRSFVRSLLRRTVLPNPWKTTLARRCYIIIWIATLAALSTNEPGSKLICTHSRVVSTVCRYCEYLLKSGNSDSSQPTFSAIEGGRPVSRACVGLILLAYTLHTTIYSKLMWTIMPENICSKNTIDNCLVKVLKLNQIVIVVVSRVVGTRQLYL